MIFALLITSFVLGGIWVYVVPMIQTYIPAAWQTNKIAQVAIAGVLVLGTVWVGFLVLRKFGTKKLA